MQHLWKLYDLHQSLNKSCGKVVEFWSFIKIYINFIILQFCHNTCYFCSLWFDKQIETQLMSLRGTQYLKVSVFLGDLIFLSLTAPGWALHQCGSRRRHAAWQCWGDESAAGCPPLALFPPSALLESWPCSAAFWWTWQRIPDLCFSLCIALQWQTVHWNKEVESQGCKENSFDLKLNI